MQRSRILVDLTLPLIASASGKFLEKVFTAFSLRSTPATIRNPKFRQPKEIPPKPQHRSITLGGVIRMAQDVEPDSVTIDLVANGSTNPIIWRLLSKTF